MDELRISPEDRQHINETLKKFAVTKSDADVFYDVCFAICAPQTTFAANRPCIEQLRSADFYSTPMPEWVLEETLTPVRFFRTKAQRVLAARHIMPDILKVVRGNGADYKKRSELKSMVKGFGMKAASHFLRNQGALGLAIIDTHILKFLNEPEGKTPSDKHYLILEEAFAEIADAEGLSVAGLDAFLWKTYSGTPWEEFDH